MASATLMLVSGYIKNTLSLKKKNLILNLIWQLRTDLRSPFISKISFYSVLDVKRLSQRKKVRVV